MTKNILKKMEMVFEELDYEILYEKGNFQSGYCIVENKNIIVINKYFDVEAKVHCLIDILDKNVPDLTLISIESKKFLRKLTAEGKELPIVS